METDHMSEEATRRSPIKGVTNAIVAAATKAFSQTSEETPLLSNGSVDGPDGAADGVEESPSGDKWHGTADFDKLPWWRRPSIFWLLPAYGVHALAIGGMIVPKVNLVIQLICREHIADRSANEFSVFTSGAAEEDPQCSGPKIQQLATAFLLYAALIGGIPAAITSPQIGALSDRYGRKPLLAVISLGTLVGEGLITVLVAKFPDNIHYSWMLAGALFDGMCGSFIAGWAMTHSYAADCIHPAKRAAVFGYIQSCVFAGISFGPIVSAYLVKSTRSLLSIFYFALACHLFYFVVVMIVPESLTRSRQLAAREKCALENSANHGGGLIPSIVKSSNILSPLGILYPTGEGSSFRLRVNLLVLSLADCMLFGVGSSVANILILYSEYQFRWSIYETNIFISVVSFCRVATLIIALPLLIYTSRKWFGSTTKTNRRNTGSDKTDLWIIRIGLAFEVVGYGSYALAKDGRLFLLSGAFLSFGSIASPTLQSSLTNHVPHSRTGQMLGAAGLLHALGRIVYPPILSFVYLHNVDSRPQPTFLILAACFAIVLISFSFVKPHVYLKEPNEAASRTLTAGREESYVEGISDEEIIGI